MTRLEQAAEVAIKQRAELEVKRYQYEHAVLRQDEVLCWVKAEMKAAGVTEFEAHGCRFRIDDEGRLGVVQSGRARSWGQF